MEGIAEEAITNVPEALDVLKRGATNRHTAKTEVNFESSRSHSVLTLTIEVKVN
jgi:Kinesin motor domain